MNFDENIAQQLIGKLLLIGITYLDSDGELKSQEQLHGIVKKASKIDGILIELCGAKKGKEWNMPPDTSCITVANPGVYKLRSTGEDVENLDYLCTWKVHSLQNNDKT